ncbi:hypothetical protein [Halomontanus rarus]|uniref:hypothetical protein n=1 Tax=Halomontanus rarus TaxID=3034020 RepID=UPI0023E8F0A9|nr:hypothetical protein [Halovivax sp. TS33]
MQFKLVPAAPDDLEYVETVQRAVPLVPGSEDDCCARIMRRTEIAPRDEARTWLTFLRALELAEEGPSGFTRTRRDPDPEHLRTAFRDRLYGVDRILEILAEADEPLSSEAVYDRFKDDVPTYEQYRWSERLEAVWSERLDRLLEWAALLDLAERVDDGYQPA